MASTIAAELDNAAFNGAGSSGEPEGVLTNSTYNITSTATSATWAGFRSAVARFMSANAVGSPTTVKVAIAPATWDTLDGALLVSGPGNYECDKIVKNIGSHRKSPLEGT